MDEIKPDDLNDAILMAHMEWSTTRTAESWARLDALREARRRLMTREGCEEEEGVTVYALVKRPGFTVVPDSAQDGMLHVYKDNGTRDGCHVHRFMSDEACMIFWSRKAAEDAQFMKGIKPYTEVQEVKVKAGVL